MNPTATPTEAHTPLVTLERDGKITRVLKIILASKTLAA